MNRRCFVPILLLCSVLLSTGASIGCGERCKLVRQGVTITRVDPELAETVNACLAAQDMQWERDAGPEENLFQGDASPSAPDASNDGGALARTWLFVPTPTPTTQPEPKAGTPESCVRVCRRVLQLVETFPGEQMLVDCSVRTENSPDPAAIHVAIAYRPPCEGP